MVSVSLARCLAKICGDGNLCKRYMRYSNCSSELLDEFKQDMITEFGDIHFITGIGNSGTHFIQIQNKQIIQHFLSFLSDFRSDVIRIPDKILNSDITIKLQFIRSLYDDEGCASLRLSNTNEWKRNVSIASNSKIILEQISYFLSSLSIVTNRIIPTHASRIDDKSYTLNITGLDNFVKFKKFIGFYHSRKANILNLIIESYMATPKRCPKEFGQIKKKVESCSHRFNKSKDLLSLDRTRPRK